MDNRHPYVSFRGSIISAHQVQNCRVKSSE